MRQRGSTSRPASATSTRTPATSCSASIVERASGKPLARFAAERIFGPLGMTSTHFHDDHTRARAAIAPPATRAARQPAGFGIACLGLGAGRRRQRLHDRRGPGALGRRTSRPGRSAARVPRDSWRCRGCRTARTRSGEPERPTAWASGHGAWRGRRSCATAARGPATARTCCGFPRSGSASRSCATSRRRASSARRPDRSPRARARRLPLDVPPRSLLIRNATIVDGTGAPARRGEPAHRRRPHRRGGRARAADRRGGRSTPRGLVLAPGFIDTHSHADDDLGRRPDGARRGEPGDHHGRRRPGRRLGDAARRVLRPARATRPRR